jgi:uncharacterized protein (TIGR02284 family)
MLFMQMSTENTSRIITVLMKNSLEMLEFYEKIYTSIDDENLKQIFEYYIGQRKEIIKELKNEASKINSEETFESLLTAFFRTKENGKAILIDGNVKTILEECEKHEDQSVKIYENAVEENLSPKLKGLVTRQYGDIKEAHYHMKLLRDSRRN